MRKSASSPLHRLTSEIKLCAHDKYQLPSKAEICYVANMEAIWLLNVFCIRRITDCREIFVRADEALASLDAVRGLSMLREVSRCRERLI